MGQYYKIVNVDKQEYLHPHQLGCGLKAWEIGANEPFGWALSILLVNSPTPRGGGDFDPTVEGVVGRWAGDRVILVGDYAEDSDQPGIPSLSTLYERCSAVDDGGDPAWRDITEFIRAEISAQFDSRWEIGKYGIGAWQRV